MKRFFHLLLLLVLAGGGYLATAHFSGGAFPTLGLPIGGELAELRRTALSFWEDIQFKDFARAASYHSPEKRRDVDIPYVIERIFAVKPEALDIMEKEVVLAELDSTGMRARIKTRLKVKLLLDGRIEEREVMLYFRRSSMEEPWYMELESSLHSLEAEEGKRH